MSSRTAPGSTPSSRRSRAVVMLPNRFDIFSPPDVEELAVQPDPGEQLLAGVGAALGDLVLMVREDQVHRRRHGCPARPYPSRRRMSSSAIAEHSMCQPGRPRPNGASQAAPTASSSGSRRLPKHEVARVLLGVLVGADPLARAGLELAPVELGQPPVGRETGRWRSRPSRPRPRTRRPDPAAPGSARSSAPMYSVARGCSVRRPDPEPVAILLERAREGIHVLAQGDALLRGAAAMVRSSTSVRFMM